MSGRLRYLYGNKSTYRTRLSSVALDAIPAAYAQLDNPDDTVLVAGRHAVKARQAAA